MAQYLQRLVKRSSSFTKNVNITKMKEFPTASTARSSLYALNYHSRYGFETNTTRVVDQSKKSTFLVGIDGTSYGYLALEHAFRLARNNDKIIGLHLPIGIYTLRYEQLLFGGEVLIEENTRLDFEKKREAVISTIRDSTNELVNELQIDSKNNNININFEFKVHEDSVAVKHDLCDYVDKIKCEYLVLGSRGHSHSIKEAVKY